MVSRRAPVVIAILLVTISTVNVVAVASVAVDDGFRYRYASILIPARMLPQLIGARAGSLEVLSFIHGEWIVGEIYILPTYKKAYNPLTREIMRIPVLTNDTITNNMTLLIRIPQLCSEYTVDWDIGMALYRLHERIYVEASLRGLNGATVDVSFYIYFDYKNSHRTPISLNTTYISTMFMNNTTIQNNYFRIETIKGIKYERHRSFIVNHNLTRVIAYDIDYEEFKSRILPNLPEPPWYLDGGSGGGGNVAPNLDYVYFIPLTEAYQSQTIIVRGPVQKTLYLGFGVSYLELNLEAVSHAQGDTLLYITIEVYRIGSNGGETTWIHTYVVPTHYMEPVVFRKYIPVPYDGKYYNVTITLNHPYASVKAYLFLAKDFDNGGFSTPTNEIKYYSFGYPDDGKVSPWTKPMNARLATGRVVLLTTPIPQGFYRGGDYGLDDSSYLRIKIQYDRRATQPYLRKVSIYLNSRFLYTVYLYYQGDVVEEEITIPYTEIKNIVAEAVKSGIGLIVSIETDAVSYDEYLAFPEILLRLPFHPEVWRPKSISFAVSLTHIIGAAEHPIFHNYNIWGWHTLVLSGHEYSGFSVDTTTLPIDHKFVAEAIASGMREGINNPETYVTDVYVELIIIKSDFTSPITSPGHSILLDGQVNSELDAYAPIIKYGHMALEAAAALYDLYHTFAGRSVSEHTRLKNQGAIAALLFVLSIGTEILLTSMANVEAGWRLSDDGEHVILYVHWSGGIQPAKYVRLRVISNPEQLTASDTIVMARSTVQIQYSAIGTGYIEAPIPGGIAYRRAEPFAITARPMIKP